MGRRRARPSLVPLLLLLALVGVLVVLGGHVGASEYEAELSEYEFLCFEAELGTLHRQVGLTFDADLHVDVYGPDGREVDVNHTLENHLSRVNFLPLEKGTYTIIMHAFWYPTMFTVDSNFDMKEVCTRFTATVKQGEWLDYEIEVRDNNRPIVLYVRSEGSYEHMSPVMLDPKGIEVTPLVKGRDNRTLYQYPTYGTGIYELAIEGRKILLPEGSEFKAICNYPISGPGIPRTYFGMTLTTIIILLILVVLAAISLAVVRKSLRRRREMATRWRPVTDISDFEQPSKASIPAQRDFSYLYAPARPRRHEGPPPAPPPERVPVVRPPPEPVIVPPPPTPPATWSTARGQDGYAPPPPPSAQVPRPAPPPSMAPAPLAHQAVPQAATRPPPPQPTSPQEWRPPPAPPAPSPQGTPPPVDAPAVRREAPSQAPTSKAVPAMKWPRCARCGNILMANHPVCSRCGAPR